MHGNALECELLSALCDIWAPPGHSTPQRAWWDQSVRYKAHAGQKKAHRGIASDNQEKGRTTNESIRQKATKNDQPQAGIGGEGQTTSTVHSKCKGLIQLEGRTRGRRPSTYAARRTRHASKNRARGRKWGGQNSWPSQGRLANA